MDIIPPRPLGRRLEILEKIALEKTPQTIPLEEL